MSSRDCAMPAKNLPSCWDDDERMNALFAPCKHASIAPEAWRQKMTFWSEQLRVWCRHRRCAVVTVSTARDAFARRGNRPACLDVVLQEYVRNGEYVPASTYTKTLSANPEGWVRWGARVAFKPAALAVGVLTSYLPFDRVPHDGMATSSINHSEEYVSQIVVKELSSDFLRSLPEECERIGTLEELEHNAKQAGYEPDSFRVLLGYMLTVGLAVRTGDLYKLAEAGAPKAANITEADTALHRLLSAQRRLGSDVDKFRQEEASALEDARKAVRLGNKPQARTHLARKQRCGQRAERSEAALENVHHLLLELRQAELNSSIVDTYRHSIGAMKRVMKDENLDEDSVHNTMDDLKDVLEEYTEVERALAGPVDTGDTAELEEELLELLASQPGDNGGTASPPAKSVDKSPKLPAVPTDIPTPPRPTDKEFVYDGEARMMAELAELGQPGQHRGRVAVPVAEFEGQSEARKTPSKKPVPQKPDAQKPSQNWYPPSDSALSNSSWTKLKNLENSPAIDALSNSMSELYTDVRLHPGQKFQPSSSKKIVYNTDFEVQDHQLNDGVWTYNARDINERRNDFGSSTAYASPNGKTFANRADNGNIANQSDNGNTSGYPSDSGNTSGFSVAPGCEREKKRDSGQGDDNLDDLERRLRNLRSFN